MGASASAYPHWPWQWSQTLNNKHGCYIKDVAPEKIEKIDVFARKISTKTS
jgi:hypothetical protein